MARLELVREQISSIEKTRAERLERAPDTGPHAMVRLFARVRLGHQSHRGAAPEHRGGQETTGSLTQGFFRSRTLKSIPPFGGGLRSDKASCRNSPVWAATMRPAG
jgi:hypothetical protein